MKNIRLILAYDGTGFSGWRYRAGAQTVEGELKRTLEMICQESLSFHVASYTDPGVHAAEQVVNFHKGGRAIDLKRLQASLNQMLPQTICIRHIEEAAADFHAESSAQCEEYHYLLTTEPVQLPFERNHAWHIDTPLHHKAMESAIQMFLEERGTGQIDGLDRLTCAEEPPHHLRFTLLGKGLSNEKMRHLIGAIVDMGQNRRPIEEVTTLFEKGLTHGKKVAPAHGLFLQRMHYSPPLLSTPVAPMKICEDTRKSHLGVWG